MRGVVEVVFLELKLQATRAASSSVPRHIPLRPPNSVRFINIAICARAMQVGRSRPAFLIDNLKRDLLVS